ncbi:hypothetical protein [Vibrio fortis]|uniref:hypothetical protein n=1 Tax=Vibrio fortis TaxID=212667 RepID=UPI0017824FCB|nr:hypothetical protein [Vibrio fortis]|tara:strand:- start:108 stop:266 length:159 start_codon:yes stop_codon:yes gene_type:complete
MALVIQSVQMGNDNSREANHKWIYCSKLLENGIINAQFLGKVAKNNHFSGKG